MHFIGISLIKSLIGTLVLKPRCFCKHAELLGRVI